MFHSWDLGIPPLHTVQVQIFVIFAIQISIVFAIQTSIVFAIQISLIFAIQISIVFAIQISLFYKFDRHSQEFPLTPNQNKLIHLVTSQNGPFMRSDLQNPHKLQHPQRMPSISHPPETHLVSEERSLQGNLWRGHHWGTHRISPQVTHYDSASDCPWQTGCACH